MLHFYLFLEDHPPVFSSPGHLPSHKSQKKYAHNPLLDLVLTHKENEPPCLQVSLDAKNFEDFVLHCWTEKKNSLLSNPKDSEENSENQRGHDGSFFPKGLKGALYYENSQNISLLFYGFCHALSSSFDNHRVVLDFQAKNSEKEEDLKKCLGEFSLEDFSLTQDENNAFPLKTRPYMFFWNPLGGQLSLSHGYKGKICHFNPRDILKSSLMVHHREPWGSLVMDLSLQWMERKKGLLNLGSALQETLEKQGETLTSYGPPKVLEKTWPLEGSFLQGQYWVLESFLDTYDEEIRDFFLPFGVKKKQNKEDFSDFSKIYSTPHLSPLEIFQKNFFLEFQDNTEKIHDHQEQKEDQPPKDMAKNPKMVVKKIFFHYGLWVAYSLERQRLDRAKIHLKAPFSWANPQGEEKYFKISLRPPESCQDYPLMMAGSFYAKDEKAWHKGQLYKARHGGILENLEEFFQNQWEKIPNVYDGQGYFFSQSLGKEALEYGFLAAQNALFWSHRCVFVTFSLPLDRGYFLTLDHHVILKDIHIQNTFSVVRPGAFFRGKVHSILLNNKNFLTITLAGFPLHDDRFLRDHHGKDFVISQEFLEDPPPTHGNLFQDIYDWEQEGDSGKNFGSKTLGEKPEGIFSGEPLGEIKGNAQWSTHPLIDTIYIKNTSSQQETILHGKIHGLQDTKDQEDIEKNIRAFIKNSREFQTKVIFGLKNQKISGLHEETRSYVFQEKSQDFPKEFQESVEI